MRLDRWIAAVLLMVGACGGSTPGSGDGPDGGGAKPDATVSHPDAAVTGSATITVLHLGQPVDNAKIVASLADGSLLGEAVTDSSGKATITVHVDGYLSAYWQDTAGNYYASTFASVQPGDDLTAKIVDPPTVTTPATTLTVSFQDAVATADGYHATDNCQAKDLLTTGSVTLQADPSCADAAGTYSLLGEALHSDTVGVRSVIAYATAKTVAGPSTTAFASADWSAAAPYTVTFTNAPANSSALYSAVGLTVNGIDFTGQESTRALAATQGATFNASIPSTVISDSLTDVYLLGFASASGRNMNSAYLQRVLPQPTAGPGPTVDLAATMLPRIHDPGFDNSDLAHIKVTFQADGGSLAGADAASVVLTWQDTANTPHIWTATFPPGLSVTLPTIPADASAWAPTAAATLTVNNALALDLSTAADYDAIRPLINQPQFGLAKTTSGDVRLSETCVAGWCLVN